MAKCEYCGKTTTFGRNIPWSKKKTRRTFRPNLQNVTMLESGAAVKRLLCTRCLRSVSKPAN